MANQRGFYQYQDGVNILDVPVEITWNTGGTYEVSSDCGSYKGWYKRNEKNILFRKSYSKNPNCYQNFKDLINDLYQVESIEYTNNGQLKLKLNYDDKFYLLD